MKSEVILYSEEENEDFFKKLEKLATMHELIDDNERFYSDLPPEEYGTSDDLIINILKNAAGELNHFKGYSDRNTQIAARKLILDGYLHGATTDRDKAVWNKITNKGRMLLESLMRETD